MTTRGEGGGADSRGGAAVCRACCAGSSENAARYGQYLFGAHNRLPVVRTTPSLFTVYGRPPELTGGLVVGVSQSGQSPDIVAVLAEGRRQGALTVAITNDPEAPLGRVAEMVLPLGVGEERGIAATKTYTAQLLMLAMLSTALGGEVGRWRELERVPTAVAEALEGNERVGVVAEVVRAAGQLVVVSRGQLCDGV
ncbi:SIS domain-containing protein [Thermomicrobium sp. 4228-Ro]|uniref:SIS domain-containing protein n=1 Tax=Thermomicrobium sp. 4228-Ro TaxID=2993937 RepID=UPI002249787A|nr:SIS domain-containing protein [Thermomicrobium sp. 4228-Ro]MCX2728073.1 SIS domain-containing protein [Thermomicrobium sp. 4228-Ro]